MALGRKLIGSAQVRIGEAVLQHGSIILDGNQDLLARVQAGGENAPPPATLRELLGVLPGLDALSEAIQGGLSGSLGGVWGEGSFRDEEKRAAEGLEAHYLDPEWTWRV
jgi:lipoate-protein ligase A